MKKQNAETEKNHRSTVAVMVNDRGNHIIRFVRRDYIELYCIKLQQIKESPIIDDQLEETGERLKGKEITTATSLDQLNIKVTNR